MYEKFERYFANDHSCYSPEDTSSSLRWNLGRIIKCAVAVPLTLKANS